MRARVPSGLQRRDHGCRTPAVAVLLGLLIFLACTRATFAALSVEVIAGIEQNRNFEVQGQWTRQWVRSLPPDHLPYLMVVHGPEAWLDEPARRAAPADVAERNAENLPALSSALEEQDLLDTENPLLLAGRVVSLLRPILGGEASVVPRYARLWELWEVLAYADQADTLSVAVSSLQLLEEHGVEARLVRYPAKGESFFGLLVPETSPEASWAYPLGQASLLPVAFDTEPSPGVAPGDVASWSWEEVLADGWSPGGEAKPEAPGEVAPSSEDPSAPPRRDRALTAQDLCDQALALGFDCVEASDWQTDNTLYVASALVILLLSAWGVLLYRQRRRRLRRAMERRRKIGQRKF